MRLTGFLGAAPEIKTTENQKKYARISLATRGVTKNDSNEWVEHTDWHKLMLWNKDAELAEKYMDKGSQLSIEGKLITRYYTDIDGVKRSRVEIIVNEVMLLGRKK